MLCSRCSCISLLGVRRSRCSWCAPLRAPITAFTPPSQSSMCDRSNDSSWSARLSTAASFAPPASPIGEPLSLIAEQLVMAAGGCHAAAAAGDPSSTSQFGFTFGSTSCRPNALQGLTFVLSSPNVARLESMRRAREVSELPEDIGCGTAASWPVAALAFVEEKTHHFLRPECKYKRRTIGKRRSLPNDAERGATWLRLLQEVGRGEWPRCAGHNERCLIVSPRVPPLLPPPAWSVGAELSYLKKMVFERKHVLWVGSHVHSRTDLRGARPCGRRAPVGRVQGVAPQREVGDQHANRDAFGRAQLASLPAALGRHARRGRHQPSQFAEQIQAQAPHPRRQPAASAMKRRGARPLEPRLGGR
eukprot:scaffold61871_cov65-Phaeocystis_antarctica.AAC.6